MDNAADDIEVFLLAKRCMCRCKLKLPAVLGDIVYDLMLTCGPCNLSEVEILADIFIMCGRAHNSIGIHCILVHKMEIQYDT